MTENKFTDQEINHLCDLYLEGQLSREEEKALFKILSEGEALTENAKTSFKIMTAEYSLFDKRTKRKKLRWIYSSVAAVALIACSVSIPLAIRHHEVSKDVYVIWQDGQQITGEEAREMAEESQKQDMEMIRQLMRQQREMMKRNFAIVNMDDYDL